MANIKTSILSVFDENGNQIPIPAIKGKSAYQIALDNGYTGTEQEWLESLKGANGTNGADGVSPTVKTEPIENGHKVTITDKDGAKSFDVLNGKNGQGSSVQSDWAVNDETSPAFVKNRPFYRTGEMIETDVAPEFTGNFVDFDAPGTKLCNEKIFPVAIGEKLSVYWDGVKYDVVGQDLGGATYIGNINILSGDSTGIEPFIYTQVYGFITKSADITHTIRVAKEEEKIIFLPDEFISPEIKKSILEKTGKANLSNGEIYNDYANNVAGAYSHAEGASTTASGDFSHAEGASTTANGNGSHAEGEETAANGKDSHAEGCATKAIGNFSHAEGYATTAIGNGSHVQGMLNVPDTYDGSLDGKPLNRYVDIVGNGTTSSRSNAYTLDWHGNGWYQGSVSVGSKSMDSPDAKLMPDGIIIKSSTPSSTKQFKITVDDTGTLHTEEIV